MPIHQVEAIVEGLGFQDASVRGLSVDKFLITLEDSLTEVGVGILEIGLNSVRKAKWSDIRI